MPKPRFEVSQSGSGTNVPSHSTDRRFNHDLLIGPEDQQFAADRWPAIKFLIWNPALVDAFKVHEGPAKREKVRVQWLGTLAVVLTLAALVGSASQLWLEPQPVGAHPGIPLFEIFSLAGLAAAVLASRYGPYRRRWLRHRFMSEVLRQWHFRWLLDERTWNFQSDADRQKLLRTRESELRTLLQEVDGSVGQKMDRLVESGDDVLGKIPEPHLPSDAAVRRELLEAYRVLRLDHQIDFAVYKLSPDDRTFAGISNSVLIWLTDQLAGLTLLLALALTIVRFVEPLPWIPFAAVSLAIAGVAARAWRDGLSLGEEFERYQEMRHHLELLRVRWDGAPTDDARFKISKEVEQAALEELRSFIRSHGKAQFLF